MVLLDAHGGVPTVSLIARVAAREALRAQYEANADVLVKASVELAPAEAADAARIEALRLLARCKRALDDADDDAPPM